MNILSRNLSLILVSGLFLQVAPAQQKDASPKPPSSPSQALLAVWNDVGRRLTAMAEDFPEDKYDFKPNPAQRTFAEQLLHAAGANYFFINPAKGLKPPSGDPQRADYKTKAAVVDFVRKSFADGAALIQQKGDAGLSDLFVDPFSNQQSRVSDGAWGLLEHSGEHYGQLVVYYRVAGLVPPESRPKK
jgi:uncharacterized damage-inducible protein DinB